MLLTELHDKAGTPLLVTLIQQRLKAGDAVLMDLHTQSPMLDNGKPFFFKHDGRINGAGMYELQSPQDKKRWGNPVVQLEVTMYNETKDAFQERSLIFRSDTFDDDYNLVKTEEDDGTTTWILKDAREKK